MSAQPPNLPQVALLLTAAAFFAAGGVLSLVRLWREKQALRLLAKVFICAGLVIGVAVLIWHSASRGNWLPLEDNFDALTWLGLLLAGFTLYVQYKRPIGGLEGFMLPLVILMLLSAAVFGRAHPDRYRLESSWMWVHRLSTYGGAVGFAIAGAVGTMYLYVNAQLKAKHARPAGAPAAAPGASAGVRLGSLERLERVTQTAVTIGFALLTLGLITGLVKLLHDGPHTALGPHPMTSPKVLLGFAVWVVYAFALHTPINPSIRGRKAAMLSIVGFVLMFGTIIAVQLLPGGGGR